MHSLRKPCRKSSGLTRWSEISRSQATIAGVQALAPPFSILRGAPALHVRSSKQDLRRRESVLGGRVRRLRLLDAAVTDSVAVETEQVVGKNGTPAGEYDQLEPDANVVTGEETWSPVAG